MAGLIRRSDIDELRSRIDIASVVGDFVALKSAGIGSMKGLCPFHDEKSPSFHVRPQVGRYHCFGCGEDGDVFTFLQKMDHVTFTEAVERLAASIGFTLHYEDGGAAASDHGNRARLLAANQAASEYFIEQLTSAGADEARRFLGGRGFDPSAAQRFGVGYAPQGWDNLGAHLKGRGFTEAELTGAGLLSTGERGSSYDRFRGRLMWPIRDQTGQTVGFGARRLYDDDKGPKYLNTPETMVYHKAQVLYGLDLAKRDIGRGRQVVIVEGYTDVMACHLAGVTTAVATCGTSFGVDHIKIIRRVMGDDASGLGEVVFTFDPDAAGQKAAVRAFAEEQRFAAQTYVAVAPDGLDPCDLRLAKGDDAVRRLLRTKRPMFEFVIKQKLDTYDLETVEGRVAALRDAAPIVADIRDSALRPAYTRQLARMLGTDLDEVSRAVEAAARRGGGATETSRRPQPGDRAPSPEPQTAAEQARPAPVAVNITDLPTATATRQERDALQAILQFPVLIGRDLIEKVTSSGFSNAALAAVRDAMARHLDEYVEPGWVAVVEQDVPEEYRALVGQLAVVPIPERPSRQPEIYLRNITGEIYLRDLLRRKDQLIRTLQRTDRIAAPDDYRRLGAQIAELEAERRAFQVE